MGAWSAGTSAPSGSGVAAGAGSAAVIALLDKLTGGMLSGGSAITDAANKMQGGMDKATSTISDAANKAMGYNAPYMNPEVFRRMSDLVTSGAFQTPFSGSYTPQAWKTPNMTLNPTMGNFFSMMPGNFGQNQPTYQPQGLPSGMAQLLQRPSIPMPQPQTPQGPQLPTNPGVNIPVIQTHNAQSTSLPGPTPLPSFPGRPNPASVLDQFRIPNPMTAKVTVPKVGSGPFIPGTNPNTQVPGGFTPGVPTGSFVPNNPSGPNIPMALMLMSAMMGRGY